MVGDWLLLEAMIKVNENFTELNEEILTVNSIRPLRSKLDIGLISSYDPITKSGTIGENIIFYKQVCDPGYIPSIGDRVLSDNVESDQGPYTWRSVTVTPVMQVSGRYMKLPVSCTPQLSKDELEELIQNKFDIVITDNLSFNMDIEDEKEMTVFIRNTGNIEHVLCKGSFATNKTQSQLSLVWPKTTDTTMKEAVRNILKGLARPLPYVIFGPPGTGKTVTLCEAVLQILLLLPDSRLLIATPSNSSANLISERLLDSKMLKPGDLVRLIAHHCLGSDSIPDKLLPYCATAELATQGTTQKREYSGKGPRTNCTFSVLGRHRITVGTCTAVGILHNMNFPYGHFSHVLIDEAGQATEPEIMVPLSLIHPDYGQVVLAGDPLQLGPVIQSRFTKSFGLDESYLTRLLRQFPYQRDSVGFKTQYDPRLITKLVMNYRSLPEILELPNSMFYDNELQPQISSSDSKEAELLCTLAPELFHKEGVPFPIIFHGINGENCKDIDSPSWYNVEEATQAYLYLSKLYKYGLSANDIGIITPYQKQVHQIQDLLLEMDMELPKISSVEGFQGQERNIIILSTVRSSSNFVDEDKKHSLGFVASPQRLNVAITRARALLIIIGNPILLAQDPYWKSVLTYCTDRSAYTGCTYFPS
ncbi:hypothetical protein KM043_018049 [Ampulex compressa]|nr:hypothetical protein KM043_018049 [Ampulex compressa]